jgi:hypothetical protein
MVGEKANRPVAGLTTLTQKRLEPAGRRRRQASTRLLPLGRRGVTSVYCRVYTGCNYGAGFIKALLAVAVLTVVTGAQATLCQALTSQTP